MANFKGGFAFNNEAAKVEVEQSPNGALISCINPVTGESMGGGNPNSVQVITGTLDNPFGSEGLELMYNLSDAIKLGNASAKLSFSGESMGYPRTFIAPIVETDYHKTGIMLATPKNIPADIVALWAEWSPVNNMINSECIMWNSDNHSFEPVYLPEEQMLAISTTLTIYWHPMPEAEGE